LAAQDLRVALQEAKDLQKQTDLKLRTKETEFQGARREAFNSTEQNKRLIEQVKEA
jgi:hypothetical protein